jgi:hypothetical protein
VAKELDEFGVGVGKSVDDFLSGNRKRFQLYTVKLLCVESDCGITLEIHAAKDLFYYSFNFLSRGTPAWRDNSRE